ncbi:mandelate racemase/muconate lactonizing enzyme family protein [Sneathiella glossodoripedis]|uniref:mandelate racemase/muconate lactonizing enzyme family protein n=1 Tax=Sneathiella glossodoripedis TaxID=418853 RepID=UPI00046EDE9B|nr:mandelate racemase/muconate lactonizing enzyme family protein [Sneathiella glossodoripedis]
MKLTNLETFVVGTPPPHWGGQFWVFCKLTTDSGVVGYGEAYAVPFDPAITEQMIRDVFERFFEGQSPFHIEKLWRRVYSAGYTQRPDVSMMSVLSALEMACWDIVGKETNQPVYNLLGGQVHERLRAYTYLYPEEGDRADVYVDADMAAERATEVMEQGFTAVKFDPAGPYSSFDPRQPSLERLEICETMVRRVREAVGTRCDILFGTHGQFTTSGAVRMARRLEKYDPLWFEEPTPPDSEHELAKLAAKTSIPIATGERLTTKYEFARVLRGGAASIIQMALGRVGGLLEGKKIAGMCEVYYAQIAPHMYCGPISAMADIQLSTCTPNFLIQESIKTMGDFHAEIVKTPIRVEEGYIIPPAEPGLGIELDEEVARANPYRGDRLHLEMSQEPEPFG